jgi:N-acetyl-beta-hexosaminidase
MEKTQVDELSNQFVDRMVNNVALMLKYEQKEQYELAKQYNDVIDDDINSYISILEVIFLESEDEKVNYKEVIERQKEELIANIRAEFERNPDFLSE